MNARLIRTGRLLQWFALVTVFFVASAAATAAEIARPVDSTKEQALKPIPTSALTPPAATAGQLRILLVDDDASDNNNIPGDKRRSPSDVVFSKLVSDAVGGQPQAWATEIVKRYANGPGIDRLRPYSLIVWYTGASYGGNPDNTSVLSIEDEKTVRRYLEETGGTVLLISPGYLSKVLDQASGWDKTSWSFLTEVLGIRGGRGLVQRFQPGSVISSRGAQFQVGKGGLVESQFSAVNPNGAEAIFSAELAAMKGIVPVATTAKYGKGRFVYVGFTFENLAAKELAPAFEQLLAAAGLGVAQTTSPAECSSSSASTGNVQTASPATVAVSGTPTTAVVNWTLPTSTLSNVSLTGASVKAREVLAQQSANSPQVTAVKVERLATNSMAVRLNVASPDALSANDPGPLNPGQAVTYRVTLMNGCDALGFKEASFTPPLPRDPTGLTATVAADRTVTLKWQPATDPSVSGYQITGTSLAAPVTVSYAAQWTSPPQAPGSQQWKVASTYAPGGVLTAPSAWPSVMSRVLPAPGKQFLLLPNGAGSTAETEAYSRTFCTDPFAPLSACSAARFIRDATNWEQVWSESEEGPSRREWVTATFADVLDLGVGRSVNCAPRKNGVTVCWATSHFPSTSSSGGSFWEANQVTPSTTPTAAAPNFPALAAQAAAFSEARSLSIIVMSDTKAFFGSWKFTGQLVNDVQGHYVGGTWTTTSPPWGALDAEHIYATRAELQTAAELDSQGRKGVPNACLSCHGGRYDPVTKLVTGASLLPLDPSRFVFSSLNGGRRQQEENMRRVNQIVLQSNPAPMIATQIRTMYNGTPETSGATVNDAAVPPGWSQQPGLYRQVILPYCSSCHFAQRGPFNFQSWGNLLQNKAAVQRTVCSEFTMPHSEILFRKFWSEGGAVSLPGMLSTALGYQKCPQ